MRRIALLSFAAVPLWAVLHACSTSDTAGAAGGDSSAASTGAGATASSASSAGGGAVDSCSDGVKNGTETDVDCGGATCPPCDAGKQCVSAPDCVDGVCTGGACQVGTCSDGVANQSEKGVDCGGPCPPTYHGMECVQGTNGSQVCSSFSPADAGVNDAGMQTFTVAISWTANGGGGFVNYVLVYGPNNTVINSQGIVGGSPVNVCLSGAYTETFELPLGDSYTYKIWRADCVNPNACAGCGSDVVIAEGGPFGVAEDPCP